MRVRNLFYIICFYLVSLGCRQTPDAHMLLNSIELSFRSGDFTRMVSLADSLKIMFPEAGPAIRKADSLIDISGRIRLDFQYSRDQLIEKIERLAGGVSETDLQTWEKKKWLEYRMIDSEKKYFNRAASNLMLLKTFYEEREKSDEAARSDPGMLLRLRHTGEILASSSASSEPVVPVDLQITFTVTVTPDAVPEGETIRCWIPWPKESHPRQEAPHLITASSPGYIIAPDSAIHRSIYMEETAISGKPAIFTVKYRYRSSGQHFNLNKIMRMPYDTNSSLYRRYTSGQYPHLCFTPELKKLADSLTAGTDDPVAAVRSIYMWFKNNIPWTGALEYSTIPVIPEYVLKNMRGDCGMQTLLFMSMLRYKGIPVRWQSGWMLPPGTENLHDWCEVYYEGTGWVPVDVSYDLQVSDNPALREFYFSGIDSYRLIANDGISGQLIPEKKFLRSDPVDFQRGEVEWKGGNLYYDKWDYEMKIEYFN